MPRPSYNAWALLCTLVLGCSAVVDFDRDRLPGITGGRDFAEAGVREDGGGSPAPVGDDGGNLPDPNMDAQIMILDDGAVVITLEDGAVIPVEAGPAIDCKTHADCPANRLCCGNTCVPTTENRCTDCEAACTGSVANACNSRVCGCGTGAACGGDKPYCTTPTPGRSVCAECRDATDCDGRTDGRTQCIQGTCAACDPGANSGCSGNTPICNATTFTCEGCKMPDNCPGTPVCTPSGACGGCTTNDADDCTSPTTPICNLAINPTMCRGCANDTECMTELAKPYCIANQRCSVCNPTGDVGCVATSATPDCRLNATSGQYQCQACNASSCPAGRRCDGGSGKCVECVSSADCQGTPARPFCGNDGTCKPCADAAGDAAADDLWCFVNTLTVRPACDASGRCVRCNEARGGCAAPTNRCLVDANPQQNMCVECRNSADCANVAGRPNCNLANHTCRGCQADSECTTGTNRTCNVAMGVCERCRTTGPAEMSGCGNNMACLVEGGVPRCVGCTGTVAGECGANSVCDTASHSCVPCLVGAANTGCGAQRPYCVAGASTSQNRCVECTLADGSQCTGGNRCQTATCTANECRYPDRPIVSDGFSCTTDSCNPTNGQPVHTPDNTPCATPPDNNMCLRGRCEGASGNMGTGCSYTAIVCTLPAVCVPTMGCVTPTVPGGPGGPPGQPGGPGGPATAL